MTYLIGLHGRRGSGKDTAFGYINDWCAERGLRAAHRGFADALKHSFARLFIPDIAREEAIMWCDELKHSSKLAIEWQRADRFNTTTRITHEISGRQALQRFGTEGHRELFNDNFWVDVLLPMPPAADFKPTEEYNKTLWQRNFVNVFGVGYDQRGPDFAVITDVRFPSEAQRIRDLGGVVWAINRPGRVKDEHASEKPLPRELVDATIQNRTTLSEFEANVIALMVSEYHMKLVRAGMAEDEDEPLGGEISTPFGPRVDDD